MGEQYKAQSPQLDWRASISQRRTWLPSLLIGVVGGLIAEFIINPGVAIPLILITVAIAVLLVSPFAIWVIQWIREAYRRVRYYPRVLEALATAERDQQKLRVLRRGRNLELWQAFAEGIGRAQRVRDQHIPLEIIGRSRDEDEGDVHLWFALPTDPRIQLGDVIALLSSVTRDLWTVLEVDQVGPDRCRGRVTRIFNQPFWERQVREAETDQSAPAGVQARLYTYDDLQSEVDSLEREAQTSLEAENG